MNTLTEPEDNPGAITLLRDCVGGLPGERLLIVSEPENSDYYDNLTPKLAANAGRTLGMKVYETTTTSSINSDDERALLIETLTGFDHVVFFSRVGDQIRFSNNSQLPPSTMCYTLDHKSLNSNFASACYHGMSEIKQAIDEAFASASEIRVTCPLGTDYIGSQYSETPLPADVTLKRFPLLIARPVPSKKFSGRVALSRFLIGTGSQAYNPYYLGLPNDVIANVDGNLITHFEGAPQDVERIENHYLNVSEQLSVEPWHVDSWHAGIHPGCHFESDAVTDIVRWSGTAFGNPRVLHFHTCGAYAPGEISWHVIDPTITIDDVPVWDNGRLYPDRLVKGQSILQRHPNLAALFDNPYRNIGLTG